MHTQTGSLTRLREYVAPARERLNQHPLYRQIRNIEQLRLFMESHVFAVWDFMSLLKTLQAQLTCVTTPWLPGSYPQASRLINEIVLGEESDSFGDGYISHFEMYLKAMGEIGANTSAIDRLTNGLRSGLPLDDALGRAGVPDEALVFVQSTFSFLRQEKPHVTAAAFTFGREDLIPGMFREMVHDLRRNFEGAALFGYYLDRHIEVDGESHGPLALRMIQDLCGVEEQKWHEAEKAAETALLARVALWDGILNRIASLERQF